MTTISTPFGAESTAAEVAADVDLTGRRAVVTGGASGIGIETARVLASAGAEVTIAVRDTDAGHRVAADIGHGVEVARLDLADLGSVAAFIAGWDGPLHLLVNNAGLMACPHSLTGNGWELQLATNHLGHFALADGLHDALAAEGARVAASARAGTCSPTSTSTTCTSSGARTTDGWRTARARRPTSCSRWRRPSGGRRTAFRRTRCTPVGS